MQQKEIAVLSAMKLNTEYTCQRLAEITGTEIRKVRSILRTAYRGGVVERRSQEDSKELLYQTRQLSLFG